MKKTIMFFTLFMFYSITLFANGSTEGKIFFNHTTEFDEGGINAFNIKRAYLTFSNDVSSNVSYKITYDMGINNAGSAHTAFLKVAMVKLKNSSLEMRSVVNSVFAHVSRNSLIFEFSL